MTTVVSSGSDQANKVFNGLLFLQAAKQNSLSNVLTDGTVEMGAEDMKAKGQSNPGAPVVRITDLEKANGNGDQVYYDLFHQLSGEPVVGDTKIAGHLESLSQATDSLKIQLIRKGVESGGEMTRQRTKHDMRKVARTLTEGWFKRFDDQQMLVHLAGDRGQDTSSDWIVPLATSSTFAGMMVNTVTPPTFDRHFYAADATGLASLASGDKFNLQEVDKMRLSLDEMANPLQPIRFKGDPGADDSPFYVLLITPKQWYDFWISASAGGGSEWRTLLSNAQARVATTGFKSPLFMGECAMWQNILIKKQPRPIRFAASSTVTVCQNVAAATTTTVTAAVNTERAILLGAQALANAYGGAFGRGSSPFRWSEEDVDHENVREHVITMMNGKKKIRFENAAGRVNDHGVMVLDTAVSS